MNNVELTGREELAAEAMGLEVMQYMKQEETIRRIARETEKTAIKVLDEIRRVLNGDSLEDPECFYRIEAIVTALGDHGIYTHRHDW